MKYEIIFHEDSDKILFVEGELTVQNEMAVITTRRENPEQHIFSYPFINEIAFAGWLKNVTIMPFYERLK